MGKYRIRDWIDGPYDGGDRAAFEEEVVRDYAQSLASGNKSITDVTLELRPYVVETADLTVAAKAWSLLSRVFASRSLKLSRHDMTRLIEYTCQRIENKGDLYVYDSGLKEMASLLRSIAMNRHFIPGDASVMIRAVFNFAKSPRFQEHPAATREIMLQVVESLIQTESVPLLRDIGEDELINGIVSLARFEKRPENLEIIFRLYSRIASSWDLNEGQSSSIWESFMRYFPVSIKGTATGQGPPTGRVLADLMLQCMYSTPDFADKTFARMIALLDESSDLSANTKKEVLRNLDACVAGYPPTTISSWSERLWDSLKFEIWNGENQEFIQKSLEILNSIANSLELLGDSLKDEKSPLGDYILRASSDCRNRIVDSRMKYLSSTGRILHVLGASSPYTCILVSKCVLPSLFLLLHDAMTEAEKTGVLTVVNELLKAWVESNHRTRETTEDMEQDFLSHSKKLFEVFSNAIMEVKTLQNLKEISEDSCHAIPAIDGVCLLFDIPNLLSQSQRKVFVRELVETILKFDHDNELRVRVVKALKHISSREPGLFGSMVMSRLAERLPETLPLEAKVRNKFMFDHLRSLQDIVDIGCEPCFKSTDNYPSSIAPFWHRNFDLVQTEFLAKLEAVLQERGQIDYAVAILAAMYNGLRSFDQALTEQNLSATPPDVNTGPYSWILEGVLKATIVQKVYPPNHPLSRDGRTYTGLVTLPHQAPKEIQRPINEMELEKLIHLGADVRPDIRTSFTHPGDSITDEFLNWVGKIIMCILQSRTTNDRNNYFFNKLAQDRELKEPNYYDEKVAHTVDLRDGPTDKCQAFFLNVYMLAGIKPVNGDDKQLTKTKEKLGIKGNTGNMAVAMTINIWDPKTPGGRKLRLVYGQYLQILIGKFLAGRDKLLDGAYLAECFNFNDTYFTHLSNRQQELTYSAITYAATAALSIGDNQMLIPLLAALNKSMSSNILDDSTARTVATGFRLLLKDATFLKKENFVKLSGLRYVRLYNEVGVKLVELLKVNDNQLKVGLGKHAARNTILVALAGILHYQNPVEVVKASEEVTEVMPILLAGTDIKNDDWAKITYLNFIKDLIRLYPDDFKTHVDALLVILTERIRNTLKDPSNISVQGRVLALDVISVLMKHVDTALHKNRRVRLVTLLDLAKNDVSYKVRQKAQYCRLEWMYES